MIDIPFDDGAVVCNDYTSTYWQFITLEAPGAGNHPVSGTREFGFTENPDGSYNFYTRGVDRFESNAFQNLADLIYDDSFEAPDKLWESFQQGINQFVNTNNGRSKINETIKNRPNYDQIRAVLNGIKPISDLGCK